MTDASPMRVSRARSPLDAVEAVSTRSLTGQMAGVVLDVMAPGLVLQIIARRGKADAVRAALRTLTGLDAPMQPARVAGKDAALIWSGASQWLLMLALDEQTGLATQVAGALAGMASISDQSDARVHLRMSGPHVRAVLEKLVGVDVHPAVFQPGTAAMTEIAQIPVHVWRLDDTAAGAAFVLAGPQSYAASLWHHVVVAAEEFGLDARVG